jgi:putative addiction module component (TIGR02574 family)
MSNSGIRLLEEILALPREERAALAEQILVSLDSNSNPDVEQMCIKIAEARLAAYQRGEITALSEEETAEWLRELAASEA